LTFAIRELLRPEAFPHAVAGLELVETHISWVILTGQYAYKIKRAVKFDFIDTSTLERRRHLCEEELRLNRRLAPELYLDVVPITATAAGLRVGGNANVVEYAVRMLQFERSQEFSELLSGHAVAAEEVLDLARTLAGFHASAAVAAGDSPFGDYDAIIRVVTENLAELASRTGISADAGRQEPLHDWLRAAFERARPRIEARKTGGFVRECHGDLHARNIVRFGGRFVPFDCLEFNPAMRWIDVANEIAFLYMDLLGYGRDDLAHVFLSAYLEVGGDYSALALVRPYAVHLALVRAKVDAIQAASASGPAAAPARERLAHRVALAGRIAGSPDPALILMSGVSGSGKSWLSERLIGALGAVRVRSDLERKRLLGLDALTRTASGIGAGIYTADLTARTYDRLLACAEEAIGGGHSVILDATFLAAAERARFAELAHRTGRRFLLVRCTAAPAVLRERLRARDAAGRDPSEADVAVLERQLRMAEEPGPGELAHTVSIDTSAIASGGPAIAAVRRALR
jgi:aminoglycoside phosphotransferase family enzyme/predicted kinase